MYSPLGTSASSIVVVRVIVKIPSTEAGTGTAAVPSELQEDCLLHDVGDLLNEVIVAVDVLIQVDNLEGTATFDVIHHYVDIEVFPEILSKGSHAATRLPLVIVQHDLDRAAASCTSSSSFA